MNEEEALGKLGLTSNFSDDELSSRYRDMAKTRHPDRGGDPGEMQEINVARDIVKASIEKQLLTVKDLNKIINSQNNAIERKMLQVEDHKNLVKQIIRDHTRPIKFYERISIAFGSLFAILNYLSNENNVLITNQLFTNLYSMKTLFLIYAFFCGIVFVSAKLKCTTIKNAIEDINDTLNYKVNYFNLLKEFNTSYHKKYNSFLEDNFTVETLSEIIPEWSKWIPTTIGPGVKSLIYFHSRIFQKLTGTYTLSPQEAAREIGTTHFIQLFISKGLEKGILKENEEIIEGRLIVQYSLSIKETQ